MARAFTLEVVFMYIRKLVATFDCRAAGLPQRLTENKKYTISVMDTLYMYSLFACALV